MSVLHVGAHAHLGVGLAPVLGVGGAAVIADAGRRDFAGGHSSDKSESGSVLHCLTRASRKYPLERRAGRPAVVVDVCHPPPRVKKTWKLAILETSRRLAMTATCSLLTCDHRRGSHDTTETSTLGNFACHNSSLKLKIDRH